MCVCCVLLPRIGEDMGDEVLLVVAEEQDGGTVAAALNMIGR